MISVCVSKVVCSRMFGVVGVLVDVGVVVVRVVVVAW